MKKIILIAFFVMFSINIMSQDRIIVALGKNSSFIETYKYYDFTGEYSLQNAYILGPTSCPQSIKKWN